MKPRSRFMVASPSGDLQSASAHESAYASVAVSPTAGSSISTSPSAPAPRRIFAVMVQMP